MFSVKLRLGLALFLFSGNDGAACPLQLNPDGTYIAWWSWFNTEEWCGFDCQKFNAASSIKFNAYNLLLILFIFAAKIMFKKIC